MHKHGVWGINEIMLYEKLLKQVEWNTHPREEAGQVEVPW